MVPNGWKLTSLGEVCSGKLQTGPFGSQLHADEYTDEGIPVLMPKDLTDFRANTVTAAKIPEYRADDLKKHYLKSGDLLFSRRGDVARFALIEKHTPKSICGTGCLKATPNKAHSALFLSYFLQKDAVKKWLEQNAVGQTMPNMNTAILSELPLMVASSRDEEDKIAKILSTWDKAIATTERLIATSQQQKKALMQQLLTGKKRLVNPETGKVFEGDWEEVKLKKLGKCLTGLTYSPDDVREEGILVLRSSNIQNGKLCFDDNVFVNKEVKDEVKTKYGDILVCVRNGSRNLIGKSAFITDRAIGQTHGAFMTLFRGKYPELVYQLFQTPQFYKQVSMNLGATINSINTSDLHKFKFKVPCDDLEVKKIASVLTAADKDIELLQAKLARLKDEKKALMQQLLTGKRRVKVDTTEAA
ncbi:restriction endonuclease subunit S [Vibrio fluvialis]|nr:restriction endonuclease subunit S [Vibrio fluvialis]ELE5893331.1 restriction endonuclease subunit S [Vibrio fluvialis]